MHGPFTGEHGKISDTMKYETAIILLCAAPMIAEHHHTNLARIQQCFGLWRRSQQVTCVFSPLFRSLMYQNANEHSVLQHLRLSSKKIYTKVLSFSVPSLNFSSTLSTYVMYPCNRHFIISVAPDVTGIKPFDLIHKFYRQPPYFESYVW